MKHRLPKAKSAKARDLPGLEQPELLTQQEALVAASVNSVNDASEKKRSTARPPPLPSASLATPDEPFDPFIPTTTIESPAEPLSFLAPPLPEREKISE